LTETIEMKLTEGLSKKMKLRQSFGSEGHFRREPDQSLYVDSLPCQIFRYQVEIQYIRVYLRSTLDPGAMWIADPGSLYGAGWSISIDIHLRPGSRPQTLHSVRPPIFEASGM
jgi:hypothetical protein